MSCGANPPPPVGTILWRGAVPAPLTQWAMQLRDHIAGFPYGQTWTMAYGGQTVTARKDYHTWTYVNGELHQGICIPGVTLYRQAPLGQQTSTLEDGDPLSIPDPSAAIFSASQGVDWGLVLASGAAAVGVVTLFYLALKGAARAALR
jgi:hypothetical protein